MMVKMTALKNIGRLIDLSAVRTNVDEKEIELLAETAKKYKCIAVYVMPCFVPEIKSLLWDEPDILIGGAVGFPSGADTTSIKVAQAKEQIQEGCQELDMVINVGKLLSKRYSYVEEEIKAVVDIAGGLQVKVILEVAYLTDDEIKKGCELSINGGAKFVKTGTGWADKPITINHIKLIKSFVGNSIKIKAAGGIRDLDTLIKMKNLGVSRFGIGLKSAQKIFEEYIALNKSR